MALFGAGLPAALDLDHLAAGACQVSPLSTRAPEASGLGLLVGAELEAMAARDDRSLGWLIRAAVAEYLARH